MPVRLPRLKPASPQIRALATLWSALSNLALAGVGVALMVEAWAPTQDLPWKPLRLADPPGLATALKFTRATRDPALCRAVLSEGGVLFTEEPLRVDGLCETRDAVRLRGGVVTLSPTAPVMTCRQALAYTFWMRHEVQPAARALLGDPIVRVEHYGTYACRRIYGRADGRPSEHARANALDVAAYRTASGRRLSVLHDFDDAGPAGAFLRRARDGACPWFGAVLSPDYNAAHRDHLHLDAGRYGVCR